MEGGRLSTVCHLRVKHVAGLLDEFLQNSRFTQFREKAEKLCMYLNLTKDTHTQKNMHIYIHILALLSL